MKTWAKDGKHLSRPGSHSRRQGRLENGWRERYPFPRVQCSGEHRGIGRSGVMAGTITLMWISGCLPAPGSLTKHPEGRWKVLADAKKERKKEKERKSIGLLHRCSNHPWMEIGGNGNLDRRRFMVTKCKKKKKREVMWRTEVQGGLWWVEHQLCFWRTKGEPENKRIHLRTGVKNARRMEMREARNRLRLLTQSSSNRARWKDPATAAAEVTNSPLQILWIFCDWPSLFFICIDVRQNRIHFSSFSVLSTDCGHPGSSIREMALESSRTILTGIVPGCRNKLSANQMTVVT